MFAVAAAIAFLLALLHVNIGVDLTVLGLLFVALHLAVGPIVTLPSFRRE